MGLRVPTPSLCSSPDRKGRRKLPGGGPVSVVLIVLELETSTFSGVSLVASPSPSAVAPVSDLSHGPSYFLLLKRQIAR